MFMGCLNKGKKLDGYLSNNLFEPRSLVSRHDELASEMIRRGYNHKSPISLDDGIVLSEQKINPIISQMDLLSRCAACKKRWEEKCG